MMKDYFQYLSKKKSFSLTIYPAEILERRAQEEIVRSDENKTYFIYAEASFETLATAIPLEADQNLFLEVLLQCLQSNIRGSDAIGMLPDNKGIVVLMPETQKDGWVRLQKAFAQKLSDRKDLCKAFADHIVPIVYPSCLQS